MPIVSGKLIAQRDDNSADSRFLCIRNLRHDIHGASAPGRNRCAAADESALHSASLRQRKAREKGTESAKSYVKELIGRPDFQILHQPTPIWVTVFHSVQPSN